MDPPGFTTSFLPAPRRNLTLPTPTTIRIPAQSSPGAPATAHPDAGPSRLPRVQLAQYHKNSPRLNSIDSRASSSSSSLLREIDRLTAACEEHERQLRVSKTTIEHRLFNEFSDIFSRLSSADDDAETLTAQLHNTLHSTRQPHEERLEALVSARKKDVETMRERTTPWQSFFGDEHDDIGIEAGKGRGRIVRVEGAAIIDGADGLGRIERWAEEVELYLTSEIIRLKSLILSISWRRRLAQRLIASASIVFALLMLLGMAHRWWAGG